MSKKKMNGKVSDAVENVKRAPPASKSTKVNGEPKFKNGKLVTPKPKTTTEKLMEMQKKKAELKAQEPELEPKTLAEAQELIESLRAEIDKLKTRHTASKLEDLPDEESKIKYFNFCQVRKYRDELTYILEQVEQIPGIEIRHNSYCECYRINNKLVGELFPLRRKWSARVNPGIVKRWDTADAYMEALKACIEEVRAVKQEQRDKPKPTKVTKKVESVQDIKQRIEKLSEGHNAIHIKNITAEIKAFVETQKYKLIDSEEGGANLLVR